MNLGGFLRDHRASGLRTVGFVTTAAMIGGRLEPDRSWARIDDIQSIVSQHDIDEIIVAITALSREELLQLCEQVEPLSVQLRLSSGLYELLTTRVEVRTLGTVPLMSVHKVRLDRQRSDLQDPARGVTGFAVVLLVLWPLLAADCRLDQARLARPGVASPTRARRLGETVRRLQVPHDARQRPASCSAAPRGGRQTAETHKLKKDPRVTRRVDGCAGTASTSCLSCSTCCSAR